MAPFRQAQGPERVEGQMMQMEKGTGQRGRGQGNPVTHIDRHTAHQTAQHWLCGNYSALIDNHRVIADRNVPPRRSPRVNLMQLGRRHFLHAAGFTAAAGFFGAGDVFGGTTRSVQLVLAAQDEAVLTWLRGFTSEVRLVGSAVLARSKGDAEAPAHWIAALVRLDVLVEALSTSGFQGLYTSGSTAFFTVGGREVSVELLPREAFFERLKELGGGQVGYDHDTLVYDPATNLLTDPLRAEKTKGMRVTRGAKDIAAAFAQLLDGFIESRRLALERTLGFKRFRNRVFNSSGAKPEVAEAVCAVLLARFVTWVSAAPVQEIEAILHCRLVVSSLRTAFGIDARASIHTAKAALAGDDAPNPRVWIEALLGSNERALGLLRTGDAFDQLRTRAALLSNT